ncbi:MAG TPA: oligosaccharide flippase family protein [Lentimicrobium sp.]|nr:oligosaccharide flippase family protein [Lentimicrobium sp.]
MAGKAAASFGSDILSVFSSNIFSLVANLAVVVLLTRKLGPEGYGLYTAVLVVPLLVVSFFQMGIRPTTVFMIGSGKYDANQVVSAVLSTLLITSSAGIIFSTIAYIAMYKIGYTPLLISLALVTIPMRLTAIYAGGVFLAKEQMRKANQMNWVTALLTLLSAVLLVWILKTGVIGALSGMMLSNLAVSAYGLWLLYKEYNVTISLKNTLIIKMIRTGVLYALSFLIIQLNFRIDIVFLQLMTDKREVGLYSLGVAVAELLWQIPLAIGIVVMTRSANTTDTRQMNERTARLLRLSLIAGFFLSIFIFLLAPFIIPLVFGQKYIPSISIIQTILPGIIMVIIFRILSGQLSGIGKPEVAFKAFIPALVLNVIFNMILIPEMGGLGAAISSNISYFAGTMLYLVLYTRITGSKFSELFHFNKEDFKVVSIYLNRFVKK